MSPDETVTMSKAVLRDRVATAADAVDWTTVDPGTPAGHRRSIRARPVAAR